MRQGKPGEDQLHMPECGKTSHWSGDEVCPQRDQQDGKNKGKRKGKGKGENGTGTGKYGKKVVYGVEGFYDAEENGGDPLAWAEEQWADDGIENAGAVYDQDETFQEFCACVDSCCSGFSLDDVEIPMCDNCDIDDEVKIKIGIDVDSDMNMFEFVHGIDDSEDKRVCHDGVQEPAGRGRLAASRPVGRQVGEQTETSFL